MKSTSIQIHNHLLQSKKVVIIPHQNPDGDALGSAVAVYEYLRQQKISAQIFCLTIPPKTLNFLPHFEHIHQDTNIFTDSAIDTIIVLDSGDLRYAGVEKHLKNHQATIINIDHHATNEHFGAHNLVLATASSTAEVLYHFFTHNRVNINADLATALLTGIITDTGSFSNLATTPTALAIASELLRAGANFKLVSEKTHRNKTLNSLRLWGRIFERLTKHEPLDLVYTYLTQEDCDEYGVSDNEIEGVTNFLNNLDNAKIILFLKSDTKGFVKASLRTTDPDTDVSALAKKFGGGGHKKAAGFTVEGDIESVLKKILTPT